MVASDTMTLLMLFFTPVCVCNLVSGYAMSQSLVVSSLNHERGMLALNLYATDGTIRRVEQVALEEGVVFAARDTWTTRIVYEPEMDCISTESVCWLHFDTEFGDDMYRIAYDPACRTLYVWYLENASQSDVLRSFMHTSLVRAALNYDPSLRFEHEFLRTRKVVQRDFSVFQSALKEAGWDTVHTHLSDVNRRLKIS